MNIWREDQTESDDVILEQPKANMSVRRVHFNQQLEKKIKQKKIMLCMNSQYNPNHYKMYVGQLGAVINNRTINSNKENQQSTSGKVDEAEKNLYGGLGIGRKTS